MDDLDRAIINTLQDGFPIGDAPYAQVAASLAISAEDLLVRLQALLADGTLTRFGPLYNAEQAGGALTLAAVQVPEARFDEVTAIINAFPEVAHNYARSHTLNMWFVLATETPQQQQHTLAAIAGQTGLQVYNMPKLKEYFVNLKLEA
ncbi:AsnC family transcriptional regulator [Methylovulum psychrotolerans]|uniref:Lrp/AsnC family transcriptional regulator n=1 Tax=Methylovulum psychrotolerans TaxID=1704499 RepID=UPI001BFFD5B2|nr:AsnC family transcriptional regulator [Methylovulum psychrotolerans]MBT9096227.1 AsnC family transcriptional regulator [Methylovulum psychrotolerans]